MERALAGAMADKSACISAGQHQQLLPAKEKAASAIPFVGTAWGEGSVLSPRVPPAERKWGQRPPS